MTTRQKEWPNIPVPEPITPNTAHVATYKKLVESGVMRDSSEKLIQAQTICIRRKRIKFSRHCSLETVQHDIKHTTPLQIWCEIKSVDFQLLYLSFFEVFCKLCSILFKVLVENHQNRPLNLQIPAAQYLHSMSVI